MKISTGIDCVGAITNMQDIMSLCIYVCAVLYAITSNTALDLILRTIMTTISQLTLNRNWDDWIVACGGQMPNLHLHFYLFISRIWALLATGATNFSITNVVSGTCLIADLNLTHHTKAIKVLKALLVNQITLHQSQGTPILVQASITSKYCPMAATYPLFPKPATPGANPPGTATCQDAKHNPANSDGGNNKNLNTESNKKVKVVETRGVHRNDKGMFYLRNTELRVMDIFPRDMAQKICADFTCKGRECTRDPCWFVHPRNLREMDRVIVKAIAQNFATNKKGWLSNYHFHNETTLSADVMAMIGGSQGPNQQ
jgi:hypothetical protein